MLIYVLQVDVLANTRIRIKIVNDSEKKEVAVSDVEEEGWTLNNRIPEARWWKIIFPRESVKTCQHSASQLHLLMGLVSFPILWPSGLEKKKVPSLVTGDLCGGRTH